MLKSPRFLLTSFGSEGDLLPMVALAQALNERGAGAVLGSSLNYRDKVESYGVNFVPLRPNMPDLAVRSDLAAQLLDPKAGARNIIELMVMKHLADSYDDTLAVASQGFDAVVSSCLAMATPLVAQKLGLPWASAVYQPMALMSAYDPPILPMVRWMDGLHGWGSLGVAVRKRFFDYGKRSVRPWCVPYGQLARDKGLKAHPDPLFDDARSAWLSLAMFSHSMGQPQPDWPQSAVQTGFPVPKEQEKSLVPELGAFLRAGPAPVVFTLGTAAVHAAEGFYADSKAAALSLGIRAVFLTGESEANAMGELPDAMMALPYADHAALFAHAAAAVHSCGIGTCAKSMIAGIPVLAVPWAHDQPDNARRLRALGVARILPRQAYRAHAAERELGALLMDPRYKAEAQRVALIHSGYDGAAEAADALLKRLART